jgi:hypothetical protein
MGKSIPTAARFNQNLLIFTHTSFQKDKLLCSIYVNTASSLSRASLIRSIEVA